MSTTDDKKKFITLDGVRVSYRAKDDTLHITSTDPDVQAGGFHLSLARGTTTEVTLRDLMIEEGVIRISETEKPFSVFNKVEQSPHGNIITVTGLWPGIGKSTVALLLANALAGVRSRVDGHSLRVAVINVGDEIPEYFAKDVAVDVEELERPFKESHAGLNNAAAWSAKLGIYVASIPAIRQYTTNFGSFNSHADKINFIANAVDIVIINTRSGTPQPERDKIALPIANFVLHVMGLSKAGELERWVDEVTTGSDGVDGNDIDFVFNGGATVQSDDHVPRFPFDIITSLPSVQFSASQPESELKGAERVLALKNASSYMSDAVDKLATFYGEAILPEAYA